jgi:hypothetical protein
MLEVLVLRIQNLFAMTSLALLAGGIFASMMSSGFTLILGQRRGFGLGYQVPLFGIAALFSVFAFLYSIGYIPFSPTMAKWHFWLSLVGVALCIAGAVIFRFAAENAKEPWTVGVNSIVVSVFAGLFAFLPVQLWFAFDLARAVLRLSKS